MRALWNYLLINVAQVYRLSMIWELALNAVLRMKHNHRVLYLSRLKTVGGA